MSHNTAHSNLRHKGVLVNQSEKCSTLMLIAEKKELPVRLFCLLMLNEEIRWIWISFFHSVGVHDAACYSSSSKALICDSKRNLQNAGSKKKSCNTTGMSLFFSFLFQNLNLSPICNIFELNLQFELVVSLSPPLTDGKACVVFLFVFLISFLVRKRFNF